MPTTISISNTEAITNCDNIVDSVDAFSVQAFSQLIIYDGTPPANVDATLSGNTILAVIDLPIPSFGPSVDQAPDAQAPLLGVPVEDSSADATGTASFFRIFDRNTTPKAVIQGTVGTSGEVLNLNSVAIQILAAVEVTALTIAVPEA